MTPISLDRTVRISDDTIFRELAGEAVLLQLDKGMYYGLDGVATRLWNLLAEGGTLRAVVEQARTEFDVDPDTLERDLVALVSDLSDRKLVVVE